MGKRTACFLRVPVANEAWETLVNREGGTHPLVLASLDQSGMAVLCSAFCESSSIVTRPRGGRLASQAQSHSSHQLAPNARYNNMKRSLNNARAVSVLFKLVSHVSHV